MARRPWDRRKDETPKAFTAFRTYLEMPRESRSYVGAYRLYSGRPEAAVPPGFFKDWFARYDWASRAALYDDHILNEELKALERQRKEARVRQARMGKEIQERGKTLLKRTDELDAMSGTTMIAQGQRIENIALGVATEITETSMRGEVTINGSVDQLLADPRTRGAALALLECLGPGEGDPDGAGGAC